MESLYQSYKDIAEFYIVYIREVHPIDGRRPAPYAEELKIRQPTTLKERCSLAARLRKDKKLTIPCLVDDMDNAATKAFDAHPDRMFVVRRDGRLGVASGRGPMWLRSGLGMVEKWLSHYRETGEELEIQRDPDEEPDRPRRGRRQRREQRPGG